jgi:hypothetical protein
MDAPANLRSFFRHFARVCFVAFGCLPASASNPAPTNQSIPWTQLGASATAQYSGDGLGVIATPRGAQLRCVLQRLEGEVTAEGLSLHSTVPGARDQLHVTASRIVRDGGQSLVLDKQGAVQVIDAHARYLRPALIEEYSVTADGIRQDFLVTQSPAGPGPLRLHLTLRGARAESSPDGAQLVLNESGRRLNYNRLHVTDATGRELAAWFEMTGQSKIQNLKSKMELAVVVEDAGALYPLRIDPTFSDANWSSMGGIAGTSGTVLAAVVDGSGNLYIGGGFTRVGDIVATNIAKWNGSSWSAVGSGTRGTARALAVSGSNLYAGYAYTFEASWTSEVAKWDSSSWSVLGSFRAGLDVPPVVNALAVSGSDLYAAGNFTTAGGNPANYIARWNGTGWSALGSGMNNIVYALAMSGSELFVGGAFKTAGGTPANHIAKWNGSSWSPLGSGMGGVEFPYVYALAVSGGHLYAGGQFTEAGGPAANYIAKWDGSSWRALSSGTDFNGPGVYALAVSGNDLYVGGPFTTAGGSPANQIAKWDGSNWSALGVGMGGPDFPYVYALAVSGGNLYAGGSFTTAGGRPANYLAKWNGGIWSAPGYTGINSNVFALAVSASDVYAGGNFTAAGESAANYIAKWNGSSWSPLGSGLNSNVQALAVSAGDLYAGGTFTTAGGTPANYIAKWNGSSWSALGSGMNSFVSALATSGNDVYAGGTFTTAGATPANCIAKWNGSSWSALGSGVSGFVYALAVSESDLYAAGTFTTAGGKPTGRAAKARIGSAAESITASGSSATIQFSGVVGYEYHVQRTDSLTPPMTWTTLTTTPLSPADDGSLTFTDTTAPPGTAYYRLVEN